MLLADAMARSVSRGSRGRGCSARPRPEAPLCRPGLDHAGGLADRHERRLSPVPL